MPRKQSVLSDMWRSIKDAVLHPELAATGYCEQRLQPGSTAAICNKFAMSHKLKVQDGTIAGALPRSARARGKSG